MGRYVLAQAGHIALRVHKSSLGLGRKYCYYKKYLEDLATISESEAYLC
jgi:hypothetical protein